MRRWIAGAALAAAVVGCSSGDDKPAPLGDSQMKPRFAPDTSTTVTTAIGGATTAPSAPGSGPTTAATPAPPSRTESSVTDRVGDVVVAVERPPAWADLAGGRVVVDGERVELRIRLGSTAPKEGDGSHTMNAAAFFDVDGNGRIDYEVWANLAAGGGWGGAYYDDVKGGARFTDASGITVEPIGDELVLRFPLSHLKGNRAFRWGLASEWGRYETIGTVASARDEAPDGDAAVRHPG